MYHCHLRFYLAGRRQGAFEPIKNMAPLDRFTHTFSESAEPEEGLAAEADVILADLRETDGAQTLERLVRAKGERTQLIALDRKSVV